MAGTSLAVEILGARIDVLTGGQGPAVTLLHRDTGRFGWTGLHEALAARYRVIAPAMPGWDESERPDWLRNVPDLAAFMGLVMDRLDAAPGALVGLGFGGWVAAELAVRGPDRIKALALHAPMGIKPEEGEILDQFLFAAEEYLKLGFASEAAYRRSLDEETGDRALRLDRNREMTTRVAWKPYMFNHGLKHLVRGLDVPALVAWGTADRIVPRSCPALYAAGIPGAVLTVIEGGGHIVEADAPESFALPLMRFLDGLR